MSDKRINRSYNQEILEEADTVASTTECTGLIPTPPVSEDEAESYTKIYSIPKPDKGKYHGLQQEKRLDESK